MKRGVLFAFALLAAWPGAGNAATGLVVASVQANRAVLPSHPFYVQVKLLNRAARPRKATVTVAGAKRTVTVRPRRRTTVKLPLTLTALGPNKLTVAVTGTKPRRLTVDVAEFKARTGAVLVPDFAGYGGQFNHHVYAALSRAAGVTDQNVLDMENKMRALHPEFSRIFFTPQAFTDPDKMQSFVRTVQFAQSTGTDINITWQGGTFQPQAFANVLLDLVRNKGITHLKWVTLQNEPNRTRMTMEAYEKQYRDLDPLIQSIRGQVKYMGGDLTRGPDTGAPNQDVWFQYLGSRMSDILDAYSIHVFWDYWDTQKLVDRLTEVRAIVDALPQNARKPIYVTEYGVRGLRTFNGAATVDPGVWEDGTAITQTNVSAFQHAWFDVLAADLGFMGTSKWDSYYGKYDNGTQAYYLIGAPQNGWPLYPMYNLLQLFTTTVKRGWQVVGTDSVPGTSRLLASYVGKKKQLTMIGLDTAGAQLNTGTTATTSYSIAGLPPSKPVNLLVWNANADGLVAPRQTVTADANGVVSVTISQHAVFVLTTVRLG
ncbi:MAG TPA: hypothetical protein VLB89_08370 [Gaiellaceae bacterium]|nr:hypothetical protein [Gaiellaceae bacterium]